MISLSLPDHPVAWNPAEALLAWQHGGAAPRTGHCFQFNQCWQRAGEEAGGIRAPGDPDLHREAGGSPQEAAHHQRGTGLPHQVHGLWADQTSLSGVREWKAPEKCWVWGKNMEKLRKSESHEENLVPLSRHWTVWGQIWRIISCMRKRREFAWEIWEVSIWVIPRWCKPFLCPRLADHDESFKAQLWKSCLCWRCGRRLLEGNSTKLKSVLHPSPAPGLLGLPAMVEQGGLSAFYFVVRK